MSPEVNLVPNLLWTDVDLLGTGEFMSSEARASASGCHTLQDKCPREKQQCFPTGHRKKAISSLAKKSHSKQRDRVLHKATRGKWKD